MKKKKVKDKMTRHHIIPRSRRGSLNGNIKMVPQSYHRAYHTLFFNMTNDEVLEYLKDVWFTTKPFIPPLVWLQEQR